MPVPPLKVLHVTPSFYPAFRYGGPTQSVHRLCRSLTQENCDVRVLTTDANGRQLLDVELQHEVELAPHLLVRYCHRLSSESISPKLLQLLAGRVLWADVVHLMAVYSFPTIPTLLVCKLLNKPVVWSPRGMLQRWDGTTRPVLKNLWESICRCAAPRATVLHVTSEEEARDSRARMPAVEVVTIPNGIEIPKTAMHVSAGGKFRVLYLGRLHPIKGIENLLSSFQLLRRESAVECHLTIAGTGNAEYIRSLNRQIEELGLKPSVTLTGEVNDGTKRELFERADLVVVPSHVESFGIVAAEALAHGVPVIASKGTPWRRVEEQGCGLWVDNSPESLARALSAACVMPLRAMGQRGRDWMQREFSWQRVGLQMAELYRGLLAARQTSARDSRVIVGIPGAD